MKMKEECKLCSVNGWMQPQTLTDFSISSLMGMRPASTTQPVDPRHDALLLSAYLLKLGDYPLYTLHDHSAAAAAAGYYQPAGPLIKESGVDADRALTRYHPTPHYHPPHPPVLQQYAAPYYPGELCYRYYRPPGPYHMPPPQSDAPMVGVGSEPYPPPPPQYYGAPPCYQHSPQRYIEYRCPCPMNACPKNVLIGPATGKAPTGGGPADALSASIAPSGAAFRAKARAARALDSAADTHGSGKDPPGVRDPMPPATAEATRPCLPADKREMYARDNLRLAGDTPGPAEAVGPPSPARGYSQPPPIPRRARLGKAMARRSLVGDDTGLLLTAPQPPPAHIDADDDVLAISPPVLAPIDLSSSDETERKSAPLVDVKKENEGPTYNAPRKTDTQALREHNPSGQILDNLEPNETMKPVKRRYSKPKLEIEMRDAELDETCKTNGIGEHVKLQKRRKLIPEQIETRIDLVNGEKVSMTKKKNSVTPKRKPKPVKTVEKKGLKRKLNDQFSDLEIKKPHIEDESRVKGVVALPLDTKDHVLSKPKTKSALVLDNLLRKNSVDRPDSKTFNSDSEINPAELFLAPNEHIVQCRKTLNLNKKNFESETCIRPTSNSQVTTTKITTKIPKKRADKLQNQKQLKAPISMLNSTINDKLNSKKESSCIPELTNSKEDIDKLKADESKIKKKKLNAITDKLISNALSESNKKITDQLTNPQPAPISVVTEKTIQKPSKPKLANKVDDVSIIPQALPDEPIAKTIVDTPDKTTEETVADLKNLLKKSEVEKIKTKRCKITEGKKISDKPKLLIAKRPMIKTDETTAIVEEACGSVMSVKRGRRRRSGAVGRRRRVPTLMTLPASDASRAPPRWSNGWRWDGESYVSKVYVNNDARRDCMALCWPRMCHASGDHVARGDCVLLRASSARAQPFVARVAHLWENPEDGEMMVSLVWYYRPEHTERGRGPPDANESPDAPDEVFASRHRDVNSVACIEDKCHVLTFNEYCRYKKRLKAAEEGIIIQPSIVPPMPASDITPAIATNDAKLSDGISSDSVLFCRKIYDFRSKKIVVPPSK